MRPREPIELTNGVPSNGLLRYMAAVCVRLTRSDPDPDAAAELLHESVLRLIRSAGRYDPARGKVRTWATYVVRWTRSARLRREWRRAANLPTAPLTRDVAGPGPDPSAGLERAEAERQRAERTRAVRRAVARLPEPRRRLVVRRFGLDGRPPARLADLAGGSVSHQRACQRVRAALDDLRQVLGAD